MALAACASAPPTPPRSPGGPAARAASYALKMVGRPYRYGGASPRGFDCSGLVQYSFRRAGVAVPRSTAQQRRASRPVALSHLRRGDLLFFDEARKASHVGVYVGRGEFVHAPASGERVRVDRLDSRYWRRHLEGARRLAL